MTTIAIDGPAAAGKGTLSRRIAEAYGYHHLDTGLTYRATAKALLDRGLPLDDEAIAADVARNLDLSGLDRAVLSAHGIGEAASKIAVMPAVRRALVVTIGSNLLTVPALWVFALVGFWTAGLWIGLAVFAGVELAVALFEGLLLALAARLSWGRAFALSLLANAASLGCGIVYGLLSN